MNYPAVVGLADRVSVLWPTLAGGRSGYASVLVSTRLQVCQRCGHREWGRRTDTQSTGRVAVLVETPFVSCCGVEFIWSDKLDQPEYQTIYIPF